MKTLIASLLLVMGLTSSVMAQDYPDISLADEAPQAGQVYSYESFCPKDQWFLPCENRLRAFIYEKGREPATDAELSYVYYLKDDKELFEGNGVKPEKRLIAFKTLKNAKTLAKNNTKPFKLSLTQSVGK